MYPTCTGVKNGRRTVGAAAIQIVQPTIASALVTLQADSTNTNNIFIGSSTVSMSSGVRLVPGASIQLPISSTSELYAISDAASQALNWLILY